MAPFPLNLKPLMASNNRKSTPVHNTAPLRKVSDDDYEIKLLEIESKLPFKY